MLVAMVLSGCGGTTPELYELVVDYFTLPDSCYSSGMQPSTTNTASPPGVIQVQVWDGPDNTPYLEVDKGGASIDMGAAPNVSIDGIFTGKKVDKGWTFASDAVRKQTLPANNVITSTTHAEFTFERGGTFKGTGTISSSSNCVGNQCQLTNNASCTVSGINVHGTRIAVQYQRAP
jgi:hypothetical protein